jgi:hypothetical protein
VRRVVARSAEDRPIDYVPPASDFNPASPVEDGSWINVQGATAIAASGQIGYGLIGGTSWTAQVLLGPGGECFAGNVGPAGTMGGASFCEPVGAPPAVAAVAMLPYAMPSGGIIWYLGTVNARTAYLRADLSNGGTSRLLPALVGGRKYIAIGVSDRLRLTRLILYDRHGRKLADLTSLPRAPGDLRAVTG